MKIVLVASGSRGDVQPMLALSLALKREGQDVLLAAVIHHGSAGTTASSAVSGVPQIIVPHALDQYFWGHHIYQSRLGSKPIWRAGLTPHRLAAAIQEWVSNQQIQQKARAVSEMISRRNSLELAVREIHT